MSYNGHRAYLRGERPLCLINKDFLAGWEPTITHHIQRRLHTIRKDNYSWELVMFYKRKP